MDMITSIVPAGRVADLSVKTNETLRSKLKEMGFIGIIRYVPLPGVDFRQDIDKDELDAILSEGFGSWFVQHPRFPGWKPREHHPEVDAMTAVQFAKQAGYVPGTHGFVDAEGMSADTTAAEAHYYNSCFARVLVEEGYRAGLYDGFSQPETPESLYEIADVTSYWSDAANRKVAVRGTAVLQLPGIKVFGVDVDPNVVRLDMKGETPYWTIAGAKENS